MKYIRRRKRKSSWKKGILLILLLLGVYYIRYQWSTYRDEQIRQQFFAQVTPLINEMQEFSELPLGFLSGSLSGLSIETYKDPIGYASLLKEKFHQVYTTYRTEKGWQALPTEIDISTTLAHMSLEQKIAQLFIFGFTGNSIESSLSTFLLTNQPGGVILLGRNIAPDRLEQFVANIQSHTREFPFFIALDQEGGPVTRIAESLPGQADVLLPDVCQTFTDRAALLHKQGINLNFGIVADVSNDPKSFIYPRVFHGSVTEKISEAVRCTTQSLSTIKHFPGHGMTSADTHDGFTTVTLTEDDRQQNHLPPFLSGIQAGVDLVMMGHLVTPWFGSLPVSLSTGAVNFLRASGFTGLVVTDDLGMMSNTFSDKQLLTYALQAGNDLLLFVNPSNPQDILQQATSLVREGMISEEDINTHVFRILAAKNKIIRWGRYVPLRLFK